MQQTWRNTLCIADLFPNVPLNDGVTVTFGKLALQEMDPASSSIIHHDTRP